MFVTCLYDIYNNPEKMEQYIKYFEPFINLDLNIHLYTSPEIAPLFINYPPNIKIFEIPVEYFELYNLGMTSKSDLPDEANRSKDTREYLSLMNTKIEFMKRSAEICEDKNIIWIDFAVLKLFKNPDNCLKQFKLIDTLEFDRVNIPGCWYKGEALYLNQVNWRFCGSFFIIPKQLMDRFYKDCSETYIDFVTNNNFKITWEVNVWYCVEFYKGKDYIKWYYALHDDSMIDNLLENVDPWTGQKI